MADQLLLDLRKYPRDLGLLQDEWCALTQVFRQVTAAVITAMLTGLIRAVPTRINFSLGLPGWGALDVEHGVKAIRELMT